MSELESEPGRGSVRSTPEPRVDAAELAERERRLRGLLAKDSYWPTAPTWTALVDAELGGRAGDGTDVGAWTTAASAVLAPQARAYLRPYALLRLGSARISAGDRNGAIVDLRCAGLGVASRTEAAFRDTPRSPPKLEPRDEG